MTFKETIDTIKGEDATLLLKFLEDSRVNKWDSSEASKVLLNLTVSEVDQFTSAQLSLLRYTEFKGGGRLYLYEYGQPDSYIYTKVRGATNIIPYYIDYTSLTKEDFPYLSLYYQTKWRKDNPTRINKKGTQFTFSMDLFSLTAFKASITKPFLRTEGKNLILAVNKAYNLSSKDMQAIKIRNKFYYVIISNTDVITKTLMANILTTRLLYSITKPNDTLIREYYNLEPDETIAVPMHGSVKQLTGHMTAEALDTYSTDVNLILGTKSSDDRVNMRMITAISAVISVGLITGNKNYLALAEKSVANLSDAAKTKLAYQQSTIAEMQNILLKETNGSLTTTNNINK